MIIPNIFTIHYYQRVADIALTFAPSVSSDFSNRFASQENSLISLLFFICPSYLAQRLVHFPFLFISAFIVLSELLFSISALLTREIQSFSGSHLKFFVFHLHFFSLDSTSDAGREFF